MLGDTYDAQKYASISYLGLDQTKYLVLVTRPTHYFAEFFVTQLQKVNGCGRQGVIMSRAKSSSLASCMSNSGYCKCGYLSNTDRPTLWSGYQKQGILSGRFYHVPVSNVVLPSSCISRQEDNRTVPVE